MVSVAGRNVFHTGMVKKIVLRYRAIIRSRYSKNNRQNKVQKAMININEQYSTKQYTKTRIPHNKGNGFGGVERSMMLTSHR
jgi:hypothetical protein